MKLNHHHNNFKFKRRIQNIYRRNINYKKGHKQKKKYNKQEKNYNNNRNFINVENIIYHPKKKNIAHYPYFKKNPLSKYIKLQRFQRKR